MKVYIETLGCPKNFNDTEVAKGCLCEERDFTLADSPEEADIIMVNTCGFINDAKKESIDKILEMSGYKESGESEKSWSYPAAFPNGTARSFLMKCRRWTVLLA